MAQSAFEALERLAQKIVEGDVVFFVGAGFSLDSERNSGDRQVKRLLIRLIAFLRVLDRNLPAQDKLAPKLLQNFQQSFDLHERLLSLPPDAPLFPFFKSDVRRLTERYFETNDWFCDAYSHLLVFGQERWRDKLGQLCSLVAEQEEVIRLQGAVKDDQPGLDATGKPKEPKDQKPPLDTAPFRPMDEDLFAFASTQQDGHARLAGKALFLDTMGFRDAEIMAGAPSEPDLGQVAASYVGKLLPRHHVIARLAREGLCTTTITTNFDLLLDGAFRLAGFVEEPSPSYRGVRRASNLQMPFTTYSQVARIASADSFFTEGKPHQTSVLVKMHGCTERYRRARDTGKADIWAQYLRSMVFTYREIQNWREDSWAADFLRTLLRTRTVVFCGYSVQDPVVHDTFRTVYEEMARLRREATSTAAEDPAVNAGEGAPAFFFGRRSEFHGLAVLQAASRAVGVSPAEFGSHPNHIQFTFPTEPGFPHLDELFRWLFHLFFRRRQKKCLETDLRRISSLLLGGPPWDTQLQHVLDCFDKLCANECALASTWKADSGARPVLDEITAWTESFHIGLLREFAASEVVHRRRLPGMELGLLRRFPWYYPASQDAGWAAWGAVVELALRRRCAGQGQAALAPTNAFLQPARCQQPTVLYQPMAGSERAPMALTILLRDFQLFGRPAQIQGHVLRRSFWELSPEDDPWPRDPPRDPPQPLRRFGQTITSDMKQDAPAAWVLWRWASDQTHEKPELWPWADDVQGQGPGKPATP